MSDRHAVLVGNSVSYGVRGRSVTRGMVRSILEELERNLTELEGGFAFRRVTPLVDKTADEARQELRKAVRAGSDGELLLFYYFGHGVADPSRDELHLYFKDSSEVELPTMIAFSEIVRILEGYKVGNLIVILDCCHAGMVWKQLRVLEGLSAKYYLMASVVPKGKALIDYSSETHIGLFTRCLLDAFRSPAAREGLGREVTFRGLFSCTRDKVAGASHQKPYPADGGLGGTVFYRQPSRPVIPEQFRAYQSKKGSYARIFALCSMLSARKFESDNSLYTEVDRRRLTEFLHPRKTGPRRIEYECVSRSAFAHFLGHVRMVGILREDATELSRQGKRMIRAGGRRFNSELFDLLMTAWEGHGIQLSDLEDLIATRVRTSRVPSMEGIYRDLRLSKRVGLSAAEFKFLIDLTGYVGALDYSTERTFFLTIPAEQRAGGK